MLPITHEWNGKFFVTMGSLAACFFEWPFLLLEEVGTVEKSFKNVWAWHYHPRGGNFTKFVIALIKLEALSKNDPRVCQFNGLFIENPVEAGYLKMVTHCQWERCSFIKSHHCATYIVYVWEADSYIHLHGNPLPNDVLHWNEVMRLLLFHVPNKLNLLYTQRERIVLQCVTFYGYMWHSLSNSSITRHLR